MVQDTCELQPGSAAWRTLIHSGQRSRGWATVSPSLDSTTKECFSTNLSFQDPSLAEPTWVSGKFKSTQTMSGPACDVMAGAGGAALDVRHQAEGTVQHQSRFYCVHTL